MTPMMIKRPGRGDEEVGRDGEDAARLPDPAQVAVAHECDDGDRDLDVPAPERGEGGGHSVGPCRHLHGDCHDVVDDQRDGGNLCHLHAEILPGHDVRPAGTRVDHDNLSVREGDEQEHDDDGQGYGQKEGEGSNTDCPDQHEEDLLGSISGGGDTVRRQYAERHGLTEALHGKALGDQRRS